MTRIVKSFCLSDSGPPGQKEPRTLIFVPWYLENGGGKDFVGVARRKLCAAMILNILIKILTDMLGYYTNIIKVNSCSRNFSEN